MSGFIELEDKDQQYYYSVLNLPSAASDYEVRDRYRQLSIQYHPDKQHDEVAKEIASKEFLKIQKAYQVLSDPFLRAVYDTLGEQGLQLKFPVGLDKKSLDEMQAELKIIKASSDRKRIEDLVRATNRLTIGVDARSLFGSSKSSRLTLAERVRNVGVPNLGLRHTIQHNLDTKTRFQLTSIIAMKSMDENSVGRGRANIIGTVRHQWSPRLNFELTTPILSRPVLGLKVGYADGDNFVSFQTRIQPVLPRIRDVFRPPCSITYSRRLFAETGTQAVISLDSMAAAPSLQLNLTVPRNFDFTPNLSTEGDSLFEHETTEDAPIEHGLAKGTSHYSLGLIFAGPVSGLRAEWGVILSRLALQLRLGATLNILGLHYWCTGAWENADKGSGVEATLNASPDGVSLSLSLRYLGQNLSLPIALSSSSDPEAAFWTSVLPAIVGVLGYHFIYQPRKIKARLQYLKNLRSERFKSSEYQENEQLKDRIIKETARRHAQSERAIDGLVIGRASYGCALDLDEARNLVIDVTAPLQSLVHKSQLYISGQQTKSGLQGFHDPAPHFPKVLSIDYTFRGRSHHAEIRDSLPVVLPLAEHLVE